MNYRIPCSLLAMSLLVGCQLLDDGSLMAEQQPEEEITCDETIPTLKESDCLLEAWVDYGLASQRGDREWRDKTLDRLQREDSRSRLARAVVMAWGSERQWAESAEILSEDLHAAPSDLQPLLRYWLNEVEGRRAMAERASRYESQASKLEQENAELTQKLDALTAIEQNMNLRQQLPE